MYIRTFDLSLTCISVLEVLKLLYLCCDERLLLLLPTSNDTRAPGLVRSKAPSCPNYSPNNIIVMECPNFVTIVFYFSMSRYFGFLYKHLHVILCSHECPFTMRARPDVPYHLLHKRHVVDCYDINIYLIQEACLKSVESLNSRNGWLIQDDTHATCRQI